LLSCEATGVFDLESETLVRGTARGVESSGVLIAGLVAGDSIETWEVTGEGSVEVKAAEDSEMVGVEVRILEFEAGAETAEFEVGA
jgi:hypothetical protein